MSSTPPSTSTSYATPSTMDSAALRSCQLCHRWMSSLKYVTHSLCSHCKDVNCNLSTRCDECREWSSDFMNAYLTHKRSFASKRSKKPVQASSISQPAVTAGPSLGSLVSVSSFAYDGRLKEAVMSALQTLCKKGSLGTNPFPFAVPFPVPDSESHTRDSSRGDGCHQPHAVGGITRSAAVGACEVKATVATTPSVQSHMYQSLSLSNRSEQVMSRSLESVDSASLGVQPSPLISASLDQLRVTEGGSLGVSVPSLSPTSLMFPLPDSGFSSLSGPSSSVPPSPSVSAVSSLPSDFSSAPPSSSFSLPSFAPSSLSSASFPSSTFVTSALPPSVPSVFSAFLSTPLPSAVSSSLPVASSSSSLSFPPPPPPPLPRPLPGFPPVASSSSLPSAFPHLYPPPPQFFFFSSSSSCCSGFFFFSSWAYSSLLFFFLF